MSPKAASFALKAHRVLSCSDQGTGALGIFAPGVVWVEDGRIRAVGGPELLAELPSEVLVLDVGDRLISPGLLDAHTHCLFAGSRHEEYALKMSGAGYEAIAAAGGGIVASMSAVAQSSPAELQTQVGKRLARMARQGVTTVEAKSGYGLRPEAELKQLRVAQELAAQAQLPRLVPTFLGLHALPPEANKAREKYVRQVVEHTLVQVAEEKLATFVDAYVDRNAFTVTEAEALARAGQRLGLGLRLHGGQFSMQGAGQLAAELGGASVDHMEHTDKAELDAMARAGVSACLLPLASFTLDQAPPPVALIRERGVELVLASDANPGTAPSESLPMAMAMGVRSYGLSVEEAWLGVTRKSAASLGLSAECGQLKAGLSADLVIWDLPHEAAVIQPWGAPPLVAIFLRGQPIWVDPLEAELLDV